MCTNVIFIVAFQKIARPVSCVIRSFKLQSRLVRCTIWSLSDISTGQPPVCSTQTLQGERKIVAAQGSVALPVQIGYNRINNRALVTVSGRAPLENILNFVRRRIFIGCWGYRLLLVFRGSVKDLRHGDKCLSPTKWRKGTIFEPSLYVPTGNSPYLFDKVLKRIAL